MGLAMAIDLMAGGPMTEAAMNPAKAVGLLVAAFATKMVLSDLPWQVWGWDR